MIYTYVITENHCFVVILQVRKVRNELMHNTNMKVSSADLSRYIKTMITLLQDPLKLLQDTASQHAATEITQVTYTHLIVYFWCSLIRNNMHMLITKIRPDKDTNIKIISR